MGAGEVDGSVGRELLDWAAPARGGGREGEDREDVIGGGGVGRAGAARVDPQGCLGEVSAGWLAAVLWVRTGSGGASDGDGNPAEPLLCVGAEEARAWVRWGSAGARSAVMVFRRRMSSRSSCSA